ncbi:polymer-forming cytoskeletal protein [Herminiimonas sp. CN]|uniref:bactofilin family protein n=1 Tax=Herminiimonas sp. CN TaxID=1349818 RepID=UPI0004736D5A|nr:polymer-forming cytoskeletal protein [Herminiimonas sp. CN]
MLRSESLFGKRNPGNPATTPGSSTLNASLGAASGIMSGAGLNIPKAANAVSPSAATATSNASTNEVGSKLIVGPNIKLKGVEITDCDTLVVEGRVEATMDSRVIQIAENGSFKGSAEIDIAEIRGEFNGDLTARVKLVIYATGKVSGKIRYGKIVIEEGGQLIGDVQAGAAPAGSAATLAKDTEVVVVP